MGRKVGAPAARDGSEGTERRSRVAEGTRGGFTRQPGAGAPRSSGYGAPVATDAPPPAETVDCPLCPSTGTRLLYQGPGFAMVRCRGCGLVRQSPRVPVAAQIDAYRTVEPEPGMLIRRRMPDDSLAPWQAQPQAGYEDSVRAADARRLRHGGKGLWIDVGASTGACLVAARDAGWKVAGVEPGERQARTCREVHGLDVRAGFLVDARFEDASAEVVSYRQVFEHVHDPLAELAEARRILSPDGLLLVEVPNFASPRYTVARARTALRLCRPFWERVNVPEHVFYYSPRTLDALLAQAGFTTLWWTTYGKTRKRAGPARRLYDRLRDSLRIGNKLRWLARKA